MKWIVYFEDFWHCKWLKVDGMSTKKEIYHYFPLKKLNTWFNQGYYGFTTYTRRK